MAIAGATLAAFVVMISSPGADSPAGEVAAATFAPSRLAPVVAPPIVRPPPVPVATPTPAFSAYTGRLSGTWLLTQKSTAPGVYPRDLLLRVRPRCDKGPCSVTASLVDPRTDETIASKRVKRTDGKYRFAIKAAITDLCRGDDGRTVQGGAKRTTEFQLQPFVDSKTGEMVLAATGSLHLNPNRRGDSVGCRDTTSEIGVQAEKLTKATRGTVKQRLSPIPQADLVPRPDFKVGIKGVRSVYYPVKGTSAAKLMDQWAATSSKKKYCGTVRYEWAKGHQTLSCTKLRWDPDFTYIANPFTGACTVTGVRLNDRISMPIARWAGPSLVPRELVGWWKAAQRGVRDHEAKHVRIYREWLPKLRSRLIGADCSETSAIFKKWNRQVTALQEAYDRSDYGP